ncbi:MAG: DUF481 domain-containing protein [Xenococcaceae cyanobacterium]
MVLLKLRRRLILGISLYQLLFLGLNNPVIASPKFNQNNIIPLITSSEERELEKKSRLSQSLEIINEMDDSQLKVILLNDLALSHAQLGDSEMASAILEQSLSIAKSFEDVVVKVTAITNIAKYYAQIGQKSQAIEILDNTVDLASIVEDKSLQGQLLLEISLKYGQIGQEESAQTLLAQSQTIIAASHQPLPEFPFTETPLTFKLGFSGNVSSFRDTTAFVGIDVNFSKKWSEDDVFVDGNIALDFDSSRTVNNYRPSSLITTVYRNHFNAKWNFFTDFFITTNQDLFSSKNDDEDLTIVSAVYVGAGLNLLRGDSRSEFLDLQLGIGPRYEYDFIDLEERRNQIDPALAIVLLGRDFSIGGAKLDQTFTILPALNDFNNYIIDSDTKLSIPLSKKWSLTNHLFLRYRNELIFEANPKLRFFFTTGLEYEF